MIKPLMKYDLKNMLKILIYFYAVSIGIAIITRLIKLGDEIFSIYIIGQVFAGITYSAIANILINTFTNILRVFITNFYKDESYLTHTLPVRKKDLIVSKYLSAVITVFLSVAVSFICIFIVHYSPEFIDAIKALLISSTSTFKTPLWLFITLIIMLLFVELFALLSFAFNAVIIAHTYSEKRMLKGFLWFILIYFASMLIMLLLAVVVGLISGNLSTLFSNSLSESLLLILTITSLVTYIGLSIASFYLSKKLFSKGVNID